MASLAIDTNTNVSSAISNIVAAGYVAVGRYYSSNPRKRLTAAEAAAISAAGLQIFAVFEDRATPALNYDSGVHDAQIALQQAHGVRQPQGTAIYFALDSELDGQDLAGVEDYFNGIKDTIAGEYKLGVYADGLVCQALLDAQTCSYAWLSASRGFPGSKPFYASRHWALAQDTPIDQSFHGLSIDINEINGDFGAFQVAVPAAAALNVAGAAGGAAAGIPAGGLAAVPPGWSGTITYTYANGLLTGAPAIASRSMAMLAVPARAAPGAAPAGSFTVHQGHRYSATIVLSGLEQFASNDMIAGKFGGYGFQNVTVTGAGATRQAQGTWTGPDTTVQLDPHLTHVIDQGPAVQAA